MKYFFCFIVILKNLNSCLDKESDLRRLSLPQSTTSQSFDISAMEQSIALLKSQLLHANHQIHVGEFDFVNLLICACDCCVV